MKYIEEIQPKENVAQAGKVVDPNMPKGNRFVPEGVASTVMVYRGEWCGCILMYEKDIKKQKNPEMLKKLWLTKIGLCINSIEDAENNPKAHKLPEKESSINEDRND